MNKEKVVKKKEIDAYMTKEQKEEIDKLQQELKRIRGAKLANEEIQKLKEEIKQTNKKENIPKNKLVKKYVNGMKKVISWWNMEGLSEEEKQAKKKRFNEAGGMFFGNDNASDRGMPSLFGTDDEDEEEDTEEEIMDHPFSMFSDRAKPRHKSRGKHTKKQSTRQKSDGYVVVNGVAYPKAGSKTSKKKTSKKKKVVKKKAKPRREREEEPEPFFNLLR